MNLFYDMLGVDRILVTNCGKEAQRYFTIAGGVVLLFIAATFISCYYMVSYVADNWFADLLVAVIVTFTVLNLYRFSVSNVGWGTDEQGLVKDAAKGSIPPPNKRSVWVKLFFLSMLLMFISKPLELLIFHRAIANSITEYRESEKRNIIQQVEQVYKQQSGIYQKQINELNDEVNRIQIALQDAQRLKDKAPDYSTASTLRTQIAGLKVDYILAVNKAKANIPLLQAKVEQLTEAKDKELNERLKHLVTGETLVVNLCLLNEMLPLTWLFTILFVLIFLSPVIWRSFFRKYGNEDYEIARIELERSLITEAYSQFKQQYNELFNSSFGRDLHYQECFLDAPFNCLPKKDETQYEDRKDLIAFLLEEEHSKAIAIDQSAPSDSPLPNDNTLDNPPPHDAN